LETATGAQLNPLSIVISTQAPTDADLLSILLDDAMAGHDPRTIVKLFTAPLELDPFTEKTIRLANPAYGIFLSRDEVTAMARDAKRMPAREAEYRNLILNQRVQINSPFVSPSVWAANDAEAIDFEPSTPVFAGLDLAEVSDLTALVMIGKVQDKWRIRQSSGCRAKVWRTSRWLIMCPTICGCVTVSWRPRPAVRSHTST
jgi:phage terminase large subunit-like protein